MEGEGSPNPSYPKLSKTSSVKLVQTPDSGSSSKLPLRPLASTRSMPSPSLLVAANQNDASSNTRSRNKSKVVEDSSSSNNNNGGQTGDTSCDGQGALREQDMMFLPITNVLRVMRKMLPTHAKISDDAKEAVQECVSEFISFITSEANERCRQEQRKTITAEDLLWSMCKLGFAEYIEPLSLYLQRYREAEGEVRGSLRGDPLPTIKRTASDAGLYGYVQQQRPQFRFMQPQGHYHNPMAFNLPQYPYLQQPQASLPGGGGSSFAAREQGLLPSSPPPMMQYCNRPEAPACHDMQPPPAGASSSSQAADPSQQPFPSFDPYTPNK